MKTRATAAVICIVAIAGAAGGSPVHFADAQLKQAVESALWLWDPTPTDMLELTSLEAVYQGITSLVGLEYAANLSELEVHHNKISDLSPLSGLTNLRRLVVNNNQISDISVLSDLTNLTHLDMHDNRITNLSALSGLVNLRTLIIRINSISDITALSGLANLQSLELSQNRIDDISALSGLYNLEDLVIRINRIDDISGLSDLTNLRDLNLQANRVSDLSPLIGLTSLRNINLGDNRITELSPLLTLTQLESVNLDGNFDLNEDAYCHDLWTLHNNGINVWYSSNAAPPVGVFTSQGTYRDKVGVSWDPVCNGPLYTSYYRVYRVASAMADMVPVSEWQTSSNFDDYTAEVGIEYLYTVRTAISHQGDNAGNFSKVAVSWLSQQPGLILSSSAGGSVVVPGEGLFPVNMGQSIFISAAPTDASLYSFAGWTGTAVDAGKVADPTVADTTVVVDGNHTLRAKFVACMDLIYVDANSHTANEDDAHENGTIAHPFTGIQKAIEVAAPHATVLVHPGVYQENINLMGKSIRLIGLDPNGAALPVIQGDGTGTIVSFVNGEDPNCLLMGFVITGRGNQTASPIACLQSSPTIANCLIVGNRIGTPEGAAMRFEDSQAIVVNCTIADNDGGVQGGGLLLVDSQIVLVNSIVWANHPEGITFVGANEPFITYCNIQGGWPDVGNIDTDPLFARHGYWANPIDLEIAVKPDDPDAIWVPGDYHLKSQTGRWDPQIGAWVQDDVTSPCIDAGDPAAPVGNEPEPHGNIVNMGVYGGTAQASKSKVGL